MGGFGLTRPVNASETVEEFEIALPVQPQTNLQSRQGRQSVAHRGSGGTVFEWRAKPRGGGTCLTNSELPHTLIYAWGSLKISAELNYRILTLT